LKLNVCEDIIRQSHMNACILSFSFSFVCSFFLLCALVHAIERETRAGYYSLCIAEHDKIHRLSCTLGTTRVIQSPGSGSFELIMENIYTVIVYRECNVSNATINISSAGSLKDTVSQIGRRSRLDEFHDVRSTECSVNT